MTNEQQWKQCRYEDRTTSDNKEKQMKRFMNKRAVAVGLAVGLTLGIAGAAAAYWLTIGSGTGSATTGSAQTVNLVQTSTNTGITPNSGAQNITGTATFSDAGPGYIGVITPSVSSVVETAGAVVLYGVQGSNVAGTSGKYYDCSAADYTLTTHTVNNTVANGSTQTFGTIAFNNSLITDQSACEGATVHLSFSSN
jgi:hypothetical protein